MIYRRLAVPAHPLFFLVLQAVVFLVGIFFLGWQADAIVVAYFFETVIIGLFHIAKMLIVYFSGNAQREALRKATSDQQNQNGFFMIPFFSVHYFFFLFVQSVFMFMFISNDTGHSFNVLANYTAMLQRADVQQAVLVSCFTHAAMTVRDFILPRVYHTHTIAGMFIQPYGRVVLQQIVVILAGFFFMLFNGAMVLAVLLIVFRTVLDAWILKWGENKEMSKSPGGFT